jgi:molybdenum cofactor cytidylyltransferase
VHNPEYADGLSTSLRRGISALPDDIEGALVVLGDMPHVTTADMERVLSAFDPVEGREICVPVYRGKRGNPVLWSRRLFPEILELRGDVGARHFIGEYEDWVCEVDMPGPGVLTDVDLPEDLHAVGAGR